MKDNGWPEIMRRDPGGVEGWGVELEAGREGGVGELQVVVWAGGLGGRPAAPVRELLRGGTELDEGGGTAAAQGVPGAGGGELAKHVVERGCAGQGMGGEVRAEELNPGADKGCGRAPTQGSVSLGGLNPEAGLAKAGGSEGGGLANAEEVDKRDEEEPVQGGFEVGGRVGGEELLEGEPRALRRGSQSGERGDSEPA